MNTTFAEMVGSTGMASSGLLAASARRDIAREVDGLVPGIATAPIGSRDASGASLTVNLRVCIADVAVEASAGSVTYPTVDCVGVEAAPASDGVGTGMFTCIR